MFSFVLLLGPSKTVPVYVCQSQWVCVCVCVSFPSILVTVPPIKARRVLHFGSVHFAAYFLYPSKPTRVTQEGGEHWGFFLPFVFSLMCRLLLQCLPPFFIARRVSVVPSLVDHDVEFRFVNSRSFSAFHHFRPPATNVRQNPLRQDSNP